ncbi:hypothetical protein ACFQZZ_12265 [Nocardia sp. GCM10030253]|uniref:hypothetical protein n=1 Tax=Nocardia sp. GCM10030253 TaxID=3273404 RepID=UPI00362F6CFF
MMSPLTLSHLSAPISCADAQVSRPIVVDERARDRGVFRRSSVACRIVQRDTNANSATMLSRGSQAIQTKMPANTSEKIARPGAPCRKAWMQGTMVIDNPGAAQVRHQQPCAARDLDQTDDVAQPVAGADLMEDPHDVFLADELG